MYLSGCELFSLLLTILIKCIVLKLKNNVNNNKTTGWAFITL